MKRRYTHAMTALTESPYESRVSPSTLRVRQHRERRRERLRLEGRCAHRSVLAYQLETMPTRFSRSLREAMSGNPACVSNYGLSAARNVCACSISANSGVAAEKPSSAGASTAWASATRLVD
jgi:hypothetical protein